MHDFANDKIDPLTAMRKLEELTGSTSISYNAMEVKKLLSKIGGA